MDGAMVVSLCTGLGGLVASLMGGVATIRASQATNARLLRERLDAAEVEAQRYRDALLMTEAKLFRVQHVLAQHGWLEAEELEHQESGPPGQVPRPVGREGGIP